MTERKGGKGKWESERVGSLYTGEKLAPQRRRDACGSNEIVVTKAWKAAGPYTKGSFTGFMSQERARLRAIPHCCTAENMQLSPSLTRRPCKS